MAEVTVTSLSGSCYNIEHYCLHETLICSNVVYLDLIIPVVLLFVLTGRFKLIKFRLHIALALNLGACALSGSLVLVFGQQLLVTNVRAEQFDAMLLPEGAGFRLDLLRDVVRHTVKHLHAFVDALVKVLQMRQGAVLRLLGLVGIRVKEMAIAVDCVLTVFLLGTNILLQIFEDLACLQKTVQL